MHARQGGTGIDAAENIADDDGVRFFARNLGQPRECRADLIWRTIRQRRMLETGRLCRRGEGRRRRHTDGVASVAVRYRERRQRGEVACPSCRC